MRRSSSVPSPSPATAPASRSKNRSGRSCGRLPSAKAISVQALIGRIDAERGEQNLSSAIRVFVLNRSADADSQPSADRRSRIDRRRRSQLRPAGSGAASRSRRRARRLRRLRLLLLLRLQPLGLAAGPSASALSPRLARAPPRQRPSPSDARPRCCACDLPLPLGRRPLERLDLLQFALEHDGRKPVAERPDIDLARREPAASPASSARSTAGRPVHSGGAVLRREGSAGIEQQAS